MADSYEFKTKKYREPKNEPISLQEWIQSGCTDEELRDAFIHMDSAMKYIHEKGYSIESFSPKDIHLLNDSTRQIKYDRIDAMPDDYSYQKEIVREDIYKSTYLQVGIYSKCYWEPTFLKENFDGIAIMLPEDDIPYYKGVIERGAPVYFSEYVVTKRERDLAALEKEMGSEGVFSGKNLVKSNGTSIASDEDKKVNESIYAQLNKVSDAAFISFLVVPLLVAVLGIIFTVVALVSSAG